MRRQRLRLEGRVLQVRGGEDLWRGPRRQVVTCRWREQRTPVGRSCPLLSYGRRALLGGPSWGAPLRSMGKGWRPRGDGQARRPRGADAAASREQIHLLGDPDLSAAAPPPAPAVAVPALAHLVTMCARERAPPRPCGGPAGDTMDASSAAVPSRLRRRALPPRGLGLWWCALSGARELAARRAKCVRTSTSMMANPG